MARRTEIFQRREALGAAVPMRHRWPELLVSAPHRAHGPSGGLGGPAGVRHARRVGDPRTVCGEPAVTWVLFWTLPFERDHPASCRRCASVTL